MLNDVAVSQWVLAVLQLGKTLRGARSLCFGGFGNMRDESFETTQPHLPLPAIG